MYFQEQKGLAKPVPFWTVRPTPVEADANMELIWVAVSVGGSAGIEGPFNLTKNGEMLRSYINPESTVKVTLPVYVNNKLLEYGDELRYYKPAGQSDEKQRKEVVADDLADFMKSCDEARKRSKIPRS